MSTYPERLGPLPRYARASRLRVVGILAIIMVLVASGCSGPTSGDERTSFASARMSADQAAFMQVEPDGGSLLVEAEFDTESAASAVVTASVGLIAFEEVDGQSTTAPVKPNVSVWLELDTGDDPNRCEDSVRSEPAAFRSEEILVFPDPESGELGAFAEIAVTAPVVIEDGGAHTIALCASVFRGRAAVRTAGVTGVVSSDDENITIEIDPA